jgi:hypothetical protein
MAAQELARAQPPATGALQLRYRKRFFTAGDDYLIPRI